MGVLRNAIKGVASKYIGIIVAILVGILLLILMINTISSGVFTVLTSFIADKTEINDMVAYIVALDTGLAEKIDNIPEENQYNHIDEFNININGVIGTNPTQIVAYLTVKYSDFTFNGVKGELDDIHGELYTVNIDEV